MATGLSANEAQTIGGDTVSPTQKIMRDLFRGAVLGILRSIAIIRPDEGHEHPAVDDSIRQFEVMVCDGNLWYEHYENVQDAIVDFEAFSSNYMYVAPVIYQVTYLTITATMQAPSGSISVAMNIVVGQQENIPLAIKLCKAELQSALNGAFQPQSGIQQPLPETTGQRQVSTEFANVSGIRAELKDNKLQYRLMPASGRWVKYGVPIYQDKLNILPFIPTQSGDFSMFGTMEIELKPDGKPSRVIAYKA